MTFATRRTGVALALCLTLSACAAHYALHPGSLNRVDSVSYDSLLIAQAVIDQGRTELAAGNLPDNIKPGLNRLIDSYNVARASWLAYRNGIQNGVDPSARNLNAAIAALNAALNTFQSSRSIS